MKKKIILVGGDPNSINTEIIYKSWKRLPNKIKKNIFLIGSFDLFNEQFKKLKYKINLIKVDSFKDSVPQNKLKVIDVKVNFKNPFKVLKKSSSKYILQSLNLAHILGLKKDVAGIINCPIDKNLISKRKIGVTEFLASKSNVKKDREVMIIKNKNLMVSPLTTHLDIKFISKKISKNLILNKINVINDWYNKKFKRKPKIAVLGLNPHNGELKKDSEEKKIIIPAIKKLKQSGMFLEGPFSSDTIFIEDYKKFDIIVGMYHDQVLSPFKSIFKFDAINLTVGLRYIRLSPDHGVAKDKILKKKSNPESLIKCFKYIQSLNR